MPYIFFLKFVVNRPAPAPLFNELEKAKLDGYDGCNDSQRRITNCKKPFIIGISQFIEPHSRVANISGPSQELGRENTRTP